MLNANKLRQVIAVDRAGSVSGAAERLHITQSTVTKALADIEREVGYALFDRRAKGVSATADGRAFLNRAARIVADLDLLTEDARVRRQAEEAVLRIGVSPPSIEGLLNRSVRHLVTNNPDLCLNLSGMTGERAARALRRGDVDVLIGPEDLFGNDPEFEIQRLGYLEARVFARHGHPLAGQKNISRQELTNYPMVSPELSSIYADGLRSLFLAAGKDPSRHLRFVDYFPIAVDLVEHTDMLGTVSVAYARSERFRSRFVMLDVQAFDLLPLCVARRARWLPTPAMRQFLNALQRFSPITELDYSENE